MKPFSRTQGVPPLPENVLARMACEAAEGLSQWHQIGFCHPDVAARSYMVTGDMTVVLGDYGTHTVAYRDDFLDTGNQLLPIRWCAPECFETSGEIVQTQGWQFINNHTESISLTQDFSFLLQLETYGVSVSSCGRLCRLVPDRTRLLRTNK